MKHFQRFVCLLSAAALLAAPVRAAEAFSDVPETSWAYENIARASELGLLGGVGDGRFGLRQPVSRAEYATMLCRLMGWEMLSPATGSFADNQEPFRWYYSAIETAYAHGALRKLSANAGVKDPLPRGEMAAMTVRALGYATLAGVVQDDCPFSDVTTNRGYIALAYHAGFMDGVASDEFAPEASATREQAATILLRVYDRMNAAIEQKPASEQPSGAAAVRVEPMKSAGGRIPMCPRAPLEAVYDAAIRAGKGGAVVLSTAPYDAVKDKTLTAEELDKLLSDKKTRAYHSARYGSSYLTYDGADGGVVWYETAEDVAEKTALCRLLGIETVYVE